MDDNTQPRPQEDDKRMERLGLEKGDYYWSPEGFLVFTEQYHRKRGYCCGNRCRHCPFAHEGVPKEQQDRH